MLDKIIHYSLHNRLLILICSLLLMFAGGYTAFHTDVDVFPDLNAPTVVVMTEANGMAPEEVERLVTFPVETAVNGATNVRRVRSSSTTGFSVVWVEFDWGMDIYLARQIVSEKLAVVSESLPENVGKPTLGPQSSILGEMMIIGLTLDETKAAGEPTTQMELRTLADWTIRPRLLSTGGVAQVAVIGGDIKEYQILLDPARMKHYGVTLDEVMAVTRNMNRNANGGVLYEYDNEYIIRGVLSTTDAAEIGKGVVKTIAGSPVLLENIATVKIGSKSPKLGMASERGKPAVLITVTKQPNTSTLELTDKLDAVMADLQKNLPSDVHVSTDVFRQSRFIDSSIDNVKRSLFEGSLFVVIILFLFLMNVRTTIISLVALPLSLLVSVLTLHYMGLTINTMSLGGMAIAIGSLVRYGDCHRFAGGRCDCGCGERLQAYPREPCPASVGTSFHFGCRTRCLLRGAYADSQLDAHHRRQLRPPLFPERNGRADVDSAGYRFHRRPLCLYGCRPDADAGAM